MTIYFHRAISAVVLLLVLFGCAKLLESVDTTYNRSVDFNALRTYDWWAIHGQEETDANDLALIRRMIDKDLQAKGIWQVDDNPDFLVVVLLRKTQQDETQEIHRSEAGDRRFASSPRVHGLDPVSWSYEEGTMVIDFVRPQTNHMVWRGTFKTDLNSATSPKKRTAVIERAVNKIMKEFPPS